MLKLVREENAVRGDTLTVSAVQKICPVERVRATVAVTPNVRVLLDVGKTTVLTSTHMSLSHTTTAVPNKLVTGFLRMETAVLL